MVLLVAPVILLFGVSRLPKFVAARHCEGGHHCSSPRECCTQGCCPPPYPSGPRPLPPPSEHVLNLFFISHWFFWCVVVAIILAILCAYSLWKKRRTLCGWGFSEHHAQSEGDSAGSCYAPPQYSRCNSFHHPPPPYTEVTSKPDLYPLVFTCNSDNGKSGSSYLMVQYFRNYIVRPAGSLSAASTVDSLSSSFICNINEANTLVPPPYSRAASPEIGFSSHFQQQYMMPRSASQLVCVAGGGGIGPVHPSDTLATQQAYQGHQARTAHYTVVAINGATGHHGIGAGVGNTGNGYNTHLHTSESEHFQREDVSGSGSSSGSGCGSGSGSGESNNSRSGSGSASNCDGGGSGSNNTAIRIPSGFMQSQSDQHFRYIANSNSSISDIFVSNSCAANVTVGGTSLGSRSSEMLDLHGRAASAPIAPASSSTASFYPPQTPSATAAGSHGTPVIYSNGRIKPNLLHRTSTNPTQFVVEPTQRESIYNSCNSIAGISLTVPAPSADRTETEFRDLHLLRHSLETCCQMLQHQQPPQQQNQQAHQLQKMNGVDSPPLRLAELAKKYGEEGPLRSYVTSGTCSGVSSLANIGTPSSPPQATSPTGGEVKEILDQIRQLQEGVSYEDMLLHMRPALRHTLSSPTSNIPMVAHAKFSSLDADPLQRRSPKSMSIELSPKKQTTTTAAEATVVRLLSTSNDSNTATAITTTAASNALHNNKLPASSNNNKRPSTLQHQQQQQKSNRKKFFTPKPNKALYIPMVSTTSGSTSISASRCILKSPVSSMVGANFFANRGGRVRKIWVSRSAPTTPGTTLPPNRLGDDSPLLTEHDEDQEGSGESNNSRSGSGSASNCDGGGSGSNNTAIRIPSGFMQSQSDQHFRYIANSNSSISDIFVSNSCAANVTVGGTSLGSRSSEMLDLHGRAASAPIAPASSSTASFYPPQTPSATAAGSHGTPVIYSNGRIKPNLLHRTSTNPTQFVVEPTQRESIYNSCNSIAGISLTVPAPSADRTETEFRDLHLLRHSLETCCQMLQHQQPPQQQNQQAHQLQKMNGVDSPPLRLAELAKKYGEEGPLRSYVTSGTCSGVSSLANIGTPSSPPQATSPTGGEVKEILDQIRQLQEGVSYEDMLLHMRPALRHTLSSPTSNIPMVAHAKFSSLDADPLQRRSPKSMSIELSPKKQTTTTAAEATVVRLLSTSNDSNTATAITTTAASNALHNNKLPASSNNNKRPSTLQHQQQQQKSNRKKFFTPKPNKALYIPMVSTTSGSTSISASRCILKSPVSSMVGANFFANRGGRVRKIWVSRSAPTTPGTTLPPNRLGDDSPLLTEHDEDQEGEQNEEME